MRQDFKVLWGRGLAKPGLNLCGEGGVRTQWHRPSQAEVGTRFSRARRAERTDTCMRITVVFRGAETSLSAAGRNDVTWFWELLIEERPRLQRRERWVIVVRRYLCFWTLRGNCDQVGQTQDSWSVRPRFKSLPCYLLVTKSGVSHSTCLSLFLCIGNNNIPCTAWLMGLLRGPRQIPYVGMILKQFTVFHVKHYYHFLSFWVIGKLNIESRWLTIKVGE